MITLQHKYPKARGSTYVAVLSIGMVVTAIGFSTLMALRIQSQTAEGTRDAEEAEHLSQAALDLARLAILSNTSWRTSLSSGVWSSALPLDRGTLTWRMVDEADNNLSNNQTDAVRLYGKGIAGSSTRISSVVLVATKQPLDVMRTTVHANGGVDVAATLNATGGPVSTNAALTGLGVLTGDAEAVITSGTLSVTGTLSVPAPIKPMPDASVFDFYKAKATPITWGSATDWTFTAPLLSAGVNPTSGSLNADGIYYIRVPSTRALNLQISRIKGTLVIECDNGGYVTTLHEINWEPHRPDLPILLTKSLGGIGSGTLLQVKSGNISEATLGANLNPSHTPYDGGADSDTTDVYPSKLKGLIYATKVATSAHRTEIACAGNINGTIIADMDVAVQNPGGTLTHDPTLYASPPEGFFSYVMTPQAGSRRREAQ